MKAFHLQPRMTTLGGVFYPTGYVVLMIPTLEDARAACHRLRQAGFDDDDVSLMAPEEFLAEIDGTVPEDDALPSPGTEAETGRRFRALAQEGHHALLVHAPAQGDSDRMMLALRGTPIAYGQKYRRLVIEDLAP